MEQREAWKRYHSFLQTVPNLKDPKFESAHWGPAIKKFTAHEMSSRKKLATHVARSEFGFRQPSRMRDAVDMVRTRLFYTAAKLTRRMSDSRTKRWEHARAITYLKRSGLYAEYRAFIRSLAVGSDMQTIRHYQYLKKLQTVGVPKHSTFLEVGAGAGNFAVLCFHLFAPRRYYIVDLPEMLAYAAFELLSRAPSVRVLYPEDFSATALRSPETAVFLLTPAQIAEVPAESADVLLNFTSFSEMERREVERYFCEFYRIGKRNALFYNVNRIKVMPAQQGSYVNNPFLFSYRSDDAVLEWQLDDFHHRTRGGLDTVPTLTVSRIARIKPI